MKRRYRMRPSKGGAAVSMAIGIAFTLIGVFVLIPSTFRAGPLVLFGLLWTGLALYGAISNALYLFGKRDFPGMNTMEVVSDEEGAPSPAGVSESGEERLKKLQSLYDQRLISSEEYEEKRKEILKDI